MKCAIECLFAEQFCFVLIEVKKEAVLSVRFAEIEKSRFIGYMVIYFLISSHHISNAII